MSYTHKVILLFLVAAMVNTGCKKKTNEPIVSSNKIDMSKITGIRFWHGDYHYSCWLCGPDADTSYNITDTFGWVYINDSTIAKQNNYLYGFDTFIRSSKTDLMVTFMSEDSWLKDSKELTYYVDKGNMVYTYRLTTSGDSRSGTLYTP